MTNPFYNPSGNPTTGAEGLSSLIRAEFAAIGAGFSLVPSILTQGSYTTTFTQRGNYTFTLPSSAGTLAMLTDVTSAVATETARAEAAEALKAPLASPAFTGTPKVGTGGATLVGALFTATGTGATTQQFEVQNLSSGTTASTDYVATSNDGTDTTYYVDFGINSSGNADGSFTIAGAHDAYLYSASSNLAIGTASAGQVVKFFTGGSLLANLRLTISDTAITTTVNGVFPSVSATTGAFTTLTAASGNVMTSGGRNRVDNGSFEIAQRTLPNTTNGSYGLDRWTVYWSGGTGSVTQSSTAGYTSRYQAQVVVTGLPAGLLVQYVHRIEAARCYDLAGQNVTISFNTAYTVSAGTTTFYTSLYYANSTDNFSGLTAIYTGAAFVPSGTPGTYSVTCSVPSAAVTGLQIFIFAIQAGATGNLTWAITSVQLEPGSSATPFERITPAQSLVNCQRFYQTGIWSMCGYGLTSATIQNFFMFPVAMHGTPTIASNALGNSNMTGPAAFAQTFAGYSVSGSVTSTGSFTTNGTFTASADL